MKVKACGTQSFLSCKTYAFLYDKYILLYELCKVQLEGINVGVGSQFVALRAGRKVKPFGFHTPRIWR